MPPVLSGAIELDNVEVLDLAVWVSISAQVHRQAKDLPAGAQITGFKVQE
jgi:hypothetical protein